MMIAQWGAKDRQEPDFKRESGCGEGLRPGTAVNASFVFWWVPAPIRGVLSDFFAAGWGERLCAGSTAL